MVKIYIEFDFLKYLLLNFKTQQTRQSVDIWLLSILYYYYIIIIFVLKYLNTIEKKSNETYK